MNTTKEMSVKNNFYKKSSEAHRNVESIDSDCGTYYRSLNCVNCGQCFKPDDEQFPSTKQHNNTERFGNA